MARAPPALVLVVEVLIAQRQAKTTLADKCGQAMLDQIAALSILETGGKAFDKTDRPAGRPKQPSTGVRGD